MLLPNNSASTAPCTSRRMCCPTHCPSHCAPCQPLLRASRSSTARGSSPTTVQRDWYVIAEQPAPAPHLARPEGWAALHTPINKRRSVPVLLQVCLAYLSWSLSDQYESIRKRLARATDTEHSNQHIRVRAARPSGRARCGAGAGCSAIKYRGTSPTRKRPPP